MTSRLLKNQQGFSSHLFGRALVAIVFMLIGWLPSLAHDFEVDGIFYNKTSGNTAAVTYEGDTWNSNYNEYSGNVVIPSSVDYNGTTYSVTSIGDDAFKYCISLKSIEIGNSVTSIGDDAFSGCSNLTSIEIPNSVTSIGNNAFSGCLRLTSIEIPNSVTIIGEWAFSNCSSLTSIQIPNSVTSIGNQAFQFCTSLTSIEIPNSVTSIGDSAFNGCESLTSIEIPNSVTIIGDFAFSGCYSLTSIEIPNSVTSIGDSAFYFCYSLTSIEIPNSVTSIGEWAFHACSSLTKITCLAATPPMIESTTFSNYSADLYVPTGCKATYEAADYWRHFNIFEGTLDNPITLNDNDTIVATIGDNIVVKNAQLGSNVRVYAADGSIIASEIATDSDVVIEAPVKGVYIVAIDGKSFKVMVK